MPAPVDLDYNQAIRTAMARERLNQTQLAEKSGVKLETLKKIMTAGPARTRNPGVLTLGRIAAALKISLSDLNELAATGVLPDPDRLQPIRVVGKVVAGTFQPASRHHEHPFEMRIPLDPDLPSVPRHGREILSSDMDEVFPAGTILICCRLRDWPFEVLAGDRVVVERWSAGQVEVLCREVRDAEGVFWLFPRSSSPQHHAPIEWRRADALPALAEAGAAYDPDAPRPDGVYVTEIVLASHRREPNLRLRRKRVDSAIG